nr:unnamed product [Ipomoea batatas]
MGTIRNATTVPTTVATVQAKNAKNRGPVDLNTLLKSALNNSNGIVNGSKNPNTVEYAGAPCGIIPTLLAASPTKVLTNAALSMLPILVFSDLQLKAPVAKRAVQVPQLSSGEIRGEPE